MKRSRWAWSTCLAFASLCSPFGPRRRRASRKRKCMLVTAAVLLLTICVLHFLILPNAMGYYTNDCYIDEGTRNNLRYLVKTLCRIFDKYDQKYFLVTGTLLGAVRIGDVLPHDGDVDIARLVPVSMAHEKNMSRILQKELKAVGMTGHTWFVRYKNVSADLSKYHAQEIDSHGVKGKYLVPYQPHYESFVHKLKYVTSDGLLPYDVVFPTVKLPFRDHEASVPRDYMAVIKQFYPFTWRVDFPYKWKCWIPTFT